jgi:hypothetical protein
MKQIMLSLIFILFGCGVKNTVELANGKLVSEHKYHSLIKKSYKKAMRQMSKEDRKFIKTTEFDMESKEY